MISDTPDLSRETLHRELLSRVAQLRRYVHCKIPKRLRPVVSADDVLQEVWLAAYRSVSSFTPDGREAFSRWLTTIANSKLVDAIRAAHRRKRGGNQSRIVDIQKRLTSLTTLLERVQSPLKTPSREFSTIENVHALSIALNCLSQDRHRAVHMRYIEGRSHAEIARQMRRTEAAVRSLIYNGLRELRSLLGDAAKYFSDVRSADSKGQETSAAR
jgi:RNA polymerase sigma-70 factor (ECF subfamily)